MKDNALSMNDHLNLNFNCYAITETSMIILKFDGNTHLYHQRWTSDTSLWLPYKDVNHWSI